MRSKSSSAVARTHSLDPAWGVRWAAASVAAVARACSWEMSVKSGGMCKFMPLGLLECLEKACSRAPAARRSRAIHGWCE
jgi:hypothetical protein